jgi:hypothetical protein
MDSSRIPNNLLNYRPHWKRSLGRPLKRWSETVTGHLALEEEEEKEKNIQLLLSNPARMMTERLKPVGLLWMFKHIKMLMLYHTAFNILIYADGYT